MVIAVWTLGARLTCGARVWIDVHARYVGNRRCRCTPVQAIGRCCWRLRMRATEDIAFPFRYAPI